MNIEKILYHSGLNQFLYTSANLIKFRQGNKNFFIIGLDLNIKQVGYIKDNFENFMKVCENILFTFNSSSDFFYKSISFGKIRQGEKIINNCLFLFSLPNRENGYVENNGIITLPKKKKTVKSITLYDGVAELIQQRQLSVRKLMKLGIIQIRARELYNLLKEKEVFVISEYNKNHKVYNFENFQKIEKNEIEQILQGGV